VQIRMCMSEVHSSLTVHV